MGDLDRTIGTFEAKIDRLEKDVATLIDRQDEVLHILNQAKGGWKTMVAVGAFVSFLTVIISKFALSIKWGG
jgi:hypothetical protein